MWDDLKDAGGKFIKIEDGEALQLYFGDGAPNKRVTHWSGGKPTECTGEGCPECARGDEPQIKWEFDVIDVAEPDAGDRVLSLSTGHAVDIKKLRAKNVARFCESIIMVSRNGSGRSTRYSFAVVGKYNPSEPF